MWHFLNYTYLYIFFQLCIALDGLHCYWSWWFHCPRWLLWWGPALKRVGGATWGIRVDQKNNIRDGGSTAHTVDMTYTVDTVYSVYTIQAA